jgi:hypothetical protein
LRLNLYLNLAAVHLQLCNYEKAVKACNEVWHLYCHGNNYNLKYSQALSIDEFSLKGLLRRSKGYRLLNEFDLASADLELARLHYPNSKEIRLEKAALQDQISKYKDTEKGLFAKMINGLK